MDEKTEARIREALLKSWSSEIRGRAKLSLTRDLDPELKQLAFEDSRYRIEKAKAENTGKTCPFWNQA